MTVQFLLDSNIISEPSRPLPNKNVLHQLELHRLEIGVASIVIHELLYGCLRLAPSKRRDYLWQYINNSVLSLPIFDYNFEAAKWHAEQRAKLVGMGKTPSFVDGQIASISYCNNLTLVTNNVADFKDFEGLKIDNWFLSKG